jgi:UMF1 family MFS transporter
MARQYDLKKVFSWALYDWANSAFATTVMAGFFPVFFKHYWSAGADISVSTFHLGMANSLAAVLVALAAPVLGAIADKGNAKKRFLLFFAMIGIGMTGALYFVDKGQWIIAAALYVFAIIGFSGGNIFYDSLIVNVAEEKNMDFVSALGFSLGYLGGGLLFALNVVMTMTPYRFGLADSHEAVRLSFISVAIWWAIFSIPIFVFIKEPKTKEEPTWWSLIRAGIRELHLTFHDIRDLRVAFLFLICYWLYIDGVHTIIRMAMDYGMSIGLDSRSLVPALLITQFVGFPAALAFGKMGEKVGTKNCIFLGIGVYMGATIWGYFMRLEWEFYALATTIGLVQGGVQSLSRSFYTRLIPKEKAAQFFGFYNMVGKFAAVLGPFMIGWISLATGNPRFSLLSIMVLFITGGGLLYFVDEKVGRRMAEAFGKPRS